MQDVASENHIIYVTSINSAHRIVGPIPPACSTGCPTLRIVGLWGRHPFRVGRVRHIIGRANYSSVDRRTDPIDLVVVRVIRRVRHDR